jgi:hypothetical protein
VNDLVGSALQATWFGIDAWRICSVAALILGYALYMLFRRGGKQGSEKKKIRAESGELVYTDAPTIRLTDTQRIDRLHKVVSLKRGEQADLVDLTFGRLPKLRVLFHGIENERGQDFAHIKIDLGGASAGCGDSVKEITDNSFLVPKAANDEQRTSILYFCGKADAVSFLQVKVKQLNPVDQTAAIDVLHVRGRWAA